MAVLRRMSELVGITQKEGETDGFGGNAFVHVVCPECGRGGGAVNQPCSGEVGVSDVDELGYCYGEFGVVFHKPK